MTTTTPGFSIFFRIVKLLAFFSVFFLATSSKAQLTIWQDSLLIEGEGNIHVVPTGSGGTFFAADYDNVNHFSGERGIYFGSHDPSGNRVWLDTIRDIYASIKGTTIDNDGNFYAIGQVFNDTLLLGSHVIAGSGTFNATMFLVKFSPSGNILWVISENECRAGDIKSDGESVFIYGRNSGDTVLGQPGSGYHYVANISKSGVLQWFTYLSLPSNGGTATSYLSITNNSLFLAGHDGSNVAYIARVRKYDGLWLMTQSIPLSVVYGLAAKPNEECVVAGGGNQSEASVLTVDSNGTVLHHNHLTYDLGALGIDVDPLGNYYTSGTISNPNNSPSYITLSKFSALGTLFWTHNFYLPRSMYTPVGNDIVYQNGDIFFSTKSLGNDLHFIAKISDPQITGESSTTETDFQIGPIPTNGLLNIMGVQEGETIRITNMLGEQILQEKVTAEKTSIELTTSPGIYIVSTLSKGISKRIVVVKDVD